MARYAYTTTPTIFARAVLYDEYGEALTNMIATKNGKRSKKTAKKRIPNGHLKALKSNQQLD
jgi:hypothetical protein